jgi:hypothetical protein
MFDMKMDWGEKVLIMGVLLILVAVEQIAKIWYKNRALKTGPNILVKVFT